MIFFDNIDAFVLDIGFFSPIIYIWYEGSELKLPLVRSTQFAASLFDRVALTSFARRDESRTPHAGTIASRGKGERDLARSTGDG